MVNVPTISEDVAMRVPVRNLQLGDVITSGETIIGVREGLRTPKGKLEVTLQRGDSRWTVLWGRGTTINVKREGNPP